MFKLTRTFPLSCKIAASIDLQNLAAACGLALLDVMNLYWDLKLHQVWLVMATWIGFCNVVISLRNKTQAACQICIR
jgi:hypothetical protein